MKDVAEPEPLPWCPECEVYAVPVDSACGECGASVIYVEGSP
jgi:predicted RNA-binding protein with PUA domain